MGLAQITGVGFFWLVGCFCAFICALIAQITFYNKPCKCNVNKGFPTAFQEDHMPDSTLLCDKLLLLGRDNAGSIPW